MVQQGRVASIQDQSLLAELHTPHLEILSALSHGFFGPVDVRPHHLFLLDAQTGNRHDTTRIFKGQPSRYAVYKHRGGRSGTRASCRILEIDVCTMPV